MGGSWQPRRFNEGVDFSTEKNPVGIGWDWLAGQVKVGKLVNLNKKDQGVDLEEFPDWHFLVLYVSIYMYIYTLFWATWLQWIRVLID